MNSRRKIRITNDGSGPLGTNIVDLETGKSLADQVASVRYEIRAGEIPIVYLEFISPEVDVIGEADDETSEAIAKIVEGGDGTQT